MAVFNKGIVFGALGAALAASAYALSLAGSLTIEGHTTAADIRTINGSAYVRLADVGKALGMAVVAKGGGSYELTKAGGANQVGDLSGKIGDTLFDGKWRLRVVSLGTPDTYTMNSNSELYNEGERAHRDRRTRLVEAGRGYHLVVVGVRIVNAMKTKETLWTALSDKRVHTALADTEGGSHPPVGMDFEGAPIQTEPMLPGAGMTFNLVFSLPSDANPKDLIFTLLSNHSEDKGRDARISLAPSGG